jgi:hypothetical protein
MIDVSDPGEQRGIAALLAVMQVSYDRFNNPGLPATTSSNPFKKPIFRRS